MCSIITLGKRRYNPQLEEQHRHFVRYSEGDPDRSRWKYREKPYTIPIMPMATTTTVAKIGMTQVTIPISA